MQFANIFNNLTYVNLLSANHPPKPVSSWHMPGASKTAGIQQVVSKLTQLGVSCSQTETFDLQLNHVDNSIQRKLHIELTDAIDRGKTSLEH